MASARLVALRQEWPEDLRWVVDLFNASPYSEGIKSNYTPRFIVASRKRNRILACSYGNNGWNTVIRPWLDKNVGGS